MSSPSPQRKQPRAEYLLLGVFLLVALISAYQSHVQTGLSRYGPRWPRDVWETAGLAAAILLAAAAAAWAGKRLVNPFVGLLAGAVGGAVASLHVSSYIGGILGAAIGGIVAYRWCRWTAATLAWCAAFALFGTLGGMLAVNVYDHDAGGRLWVVVSAVGVTIAVGAALAYRAPLFRRAAKSPEAKPRSRGWGRAILGTLLWLCVVTGLALGPTADQLIRIWSVEDGLRVSYGLAPVEPRAISQGLIAIQSIHGWGRTTEPDLARFRGLPYLRDISLSGPGVTDEALVQIEDASQLWWLTLRDTQITDDGVRRIRILRSLSTVDLSGTQVSDKGFEHLSQLPSLLVLNLANTRVTSDGLRYLLPPPQGPSNAATPEVAGAPAAAAPTALRELNLSGTEVDDSGMKYLAQLPSLNRLSLSGTAVTDDGLAQLAASKTLRTLILIDTQITDDGLKHLGAMTGLGNLDLTGTEITDEGLASLQSLASLKWLELDGTAVTDEGLKHLTNLKQLDMVHLNNTRVTAEGARALERALPTSVYFDERGQTGMPSGN